MMTGVGSTVVVLLLATCAVVHALPCIFREFPEGLVCVCNATYCDTLEGSLTPVDRDHVIIVSSSKGGLRFNVQNHQFVRTRTATTDDDYEDEGDGNSVTHQMSTVRSVVLNRRSQRHVHRRQKRSKEAIVGVLEKPFIGLVDKLNDTNKIDKYNVTGAVSGLLHKPAGDVSETSAESLLDKQKNSSDELTIDQQNLTSPLNLSIQKATVTVNRNRSYQSIVGFGGAFTGSVSYLLQQVPLVLANSLYRMYYSLTEGIGYTMMRIPIGGCDFDLEPWAYNEQPADDPTLSNFYQLDQRDLERISQLRQLVGVTDNAQLKLVGAAWSPPPWMKSNNEWSGFGVLRPEYYRTWAEYHLRYLRLMAAQNVRFWAISTGNEPLNGVIGWVFVHFMSLGWTAPNQGVWVGEHLGPLLRASTMADVKLLGADDQRYVFPWWFEKMEEAQADSVNYLDGFAVHWYWDKLAPVSLLDKANTKWPDKLILNTESCIGDKPFQTHGPLLGSWDRAEEYIKAYMEDLQHSVNGWIDWNLVLDENGGPNYTNNTVDAPVIVNLNTNELYKQPMFYAIGHFSRFVQPDSVRIDVQSLHPNVLAIGFQRPDQSIAVVLYNKSKLPASITIKDDGRKIELNVPGKSLHTVIYL